MKRVIADQLNECRETGPSPSGAQRITPSTAEPIHADCVHQARERHRITHIALAHMFPRATANLFPIQSAAMSASLPPPPKGWTDVEEAVGTPIGRTRLILCKAPLSTTRFNVPASRAFTPAMLVQQQRDLGRQIKYVVQVSVRPGAASGAGAAAEECVSDRSEFYDATVELRPHGCQFVHVQVELDPEASAPGVSSLDPRARPCPISARSIEQFVRVLRGIMAATEAAEEHERKKAAAAAAGSSAAAAAASSAPSAAPLPAYVAVHDLYGYNLCGFLLTCFLCEEYGMDIGQAVGDVGDSRPPGIYVAALLQSLLARYNDPDEEALAGGMLAAAASGAPGNVHIARLTCIPLIPELPRPDWHQLPWTWSGTQVQSTSSAPAASASVANGPSDPAAAAAALAAPGEEFKRKIRKKAAPAVAPAPSISASPLPSAVAPPSSAAGAAAAAAAAPKRPFAEFAPPADDPANKRAKVAAPSPIPAAAAAASSGPRSPQPRFAVQPPAPRSPQPLFHVQPSAPAPLAAAASSSSSSSNGAAAAAASASDLVAQLKRDHPFLVPVRADKLPSLQAVLAQMFPAATAAKFKAGGSGDAYAFLRPPALTGDVLKQMQQGPASSRAPFMLSWLPHHLPCLMLLLREHVYLIFDQHNWCLVPHMHFPKRKTPQDNVNKSGKLTQTCSREKQGALHKSESYG